MFIETQSRKWSWSCCLIALMGLGGWARSSAITIYDVHLDTSALAGSSGSIQFLAFDLIAGDAENGNNIVRAFDFTTDGSLGTTGAVVLKDLNFFNEELRDITFGTFLGFSIELTENHVPPGFDQFSFFILDETGFLPLVSTTDPTGSEALFAIDIDGTSGGAASVYFSLTPGVSWTVDLRDTSAVPETGGFSLMLLSVLGLEWTRRRLGNPFGKTHRQSALRVGQELTVSGPHSGIVGAAPSGGETAARKVLPGFVWKTGQARNVG